jgi:uncharacterized protein YbcV (DUF1398 family)
MSKAIHNLNRAMEQAAAMRPRVGRFPSKSTFPKFLQASWHAGVVRYEVDFAVRTVTYFGCNGEEYVKAYPAVEISQEPR